MRRQPKAWGASPTPWSYHLSRSGESHVVHDARGDLVAAFKLEEDAVRVCEIVNRASHAEEAGAG